MTQTTLRTETGSPAAKPQGHCVAALRTALTFAQLIAEQDEPAAVRCLAASASSPTELADVLGSQALVGFLFSRGGQSAIPPTWDDDLIERLRAVYASQVERLDELLDILSAIDDVLVQGGIEFIALKGPLFGARYYDSPYRRRMHDLDILIRDEQASGCIERLESIGFATEEPRERALSARKRRLDHAACLQRNGHQIDMHWQLRSAAVYRIDQERLWREAHSFPWRGRIYRVLSPDGEITLHLLSIAHDLERSACLVKHLVDAYCLIRRHEPSIDWHDFLRRRARESTATVCLNVLDLLLRLFRCGEAWPRIRAVVGPERGRIVCRTNDDAIRLLAGRRGNFSNQRWFARVYPNWHWRAVRQFVDRNLERPQRVPWLMIKAIRRRLAA